MEVTTFEKILRVRFANHFLPTKSKGFEAVISPSVSENQMNIYTYVAEA